MSLEWFLALRFLKEGRSQTLLVLCGVTVGVGVVVFLSALITGLQGSLIRQTLGSQAHVVVRPVEDEPRLLSPPLEAQSLRRERAPQRTATITGWSETLEQIQTIPYVVAAAPTVAGSAFASRGPVNKAISLRGVDLSSFDRIISLKERLVAGSGTLSGAETIIGIELARDLGLSAGEKLRLTAAGDRADVFTVTGIFDLGNKDLNERWVFVPLRAAQSLLDLGGDISTIEVRVSEIFRADEVASQIAARTSLVADSWTRLNRQLLIALQSQDSSSYMIQFFVVAAVALGIASVLVVSVVQKSREIGILKAVGVPARQVRRVFLYQGGLLGLAGSLGGCVLGAALALFFSRLATNPDGSPTFPVNLDPLFFAGSIVGATLVGLFAAVTPAARAARLDAAEVIRNG